MEIKTTDIWTQGLFGLGRLENVVESDWAVFRAPVAEPGYCRPLTSVFPTFASGPFLTAI